MNCVKFLPSPAAIETGAGSPKNNALLPKIRRTRWKGRGADSGRISLSERFYRLIVGGLLLALLYFELAGVISILISVLLWEGITNFRIPLILSGIRLARNGSFGDSSELSPGAYLTRIAFDAERAWRLTVAGILVLSVFVFNEQLWFFPWFMGFAIFGAGLSGVCPGLISLKLIGFR